METLMEKIRLQKIASEYYGFEKRPITNTTKDYFAFSAKPDLTLKNKIKKVSSLSVIQYFNSVDSDIRRRVSKP